jgi:sugar/nucleoside kinase (ribokinase family)
VPAVLVAGHICVDVIPALRFRPETMPGSLSEIGPLALVPGGCVANTASTLAFLGESVRIAADVGDDELGRILRAGLEDMRLDPSKLQIVPSLGTSYSIVIEPEGSDRSIWHHVGANAHFDGTALDLADAAVLHLGYAPLLPALLDAQGTALSALLERARQHGATTSVDLSVVDRRSPLHHFDWRSFLRRVLPYVDVLSPSADDLGSMLGTGSVRSVAELHVLASTLVDWGAAVAVITAGDEGLVLQTARKERLEKAGAVLSRHADAWADASVWVPAPRVTVKSTTGAGDAASAGLLHALLRGQHPRTAANTAARVAAAKVGGILTSHSPDPTDS